MSKEKPSPGICKAVIVRGEVVGTSLQASIILSIWQRLIEEAKDIQSMHEVMDDQPLSQISVCCRPGKVRLLSSWHGG